jgi:transcription elongation factor GreA
MSAAQYQPSPEANRIQKLSRLKKFDDVEAALMSAIESNSLNLDDIFSVLEVVAEQNDPKRAESILWMVLTSWAEKKGPQESLNAARRAPAILPQNDTIRSEIIELYRKVYAANTPQIEILLEITLLRKNTPLALAVQQMDKAIELLGHKFVLDLNLNLPAQVLGLNTEKKEFTLKVAGGEKSYDAVAILKLQPLSETDFRALAIFDRDNLLKLAQEKPEELILQVLKTFGPALSFRDLKSNITQVITSSAWTKWWATAKIQVNKSAFIEMSGGNQPILTMRTKPLTYEQRLRTQFENTDSFEEKNLTILDFLKDHTHDAEPDPYLLQIFTYTLKQEINSPDPALKLAAQAVLTEIHKKFPNLVPAGNFQIDTLPDWSTLFGATFNDEVAQCILQYIREQKPAEWYEIFAAALPAASIGTCDWIVSELNREPVREPLTRAIEAILHWPDKYVRAIIWLYKSACCVETPPEFLANIDHATILTGLLTAAQILKRKSPIANSEQQKRTLTQIKNAISADNYALVREVLKKSKNDYAGYLKDTLPRNTGLGDALSSDIVMIIRETHPALFSKALPPWEEDAIYTTQAALDRRNQEYAKLVNVDIAHNAKTIGEAAERGDLSENAEFTAALEERDRLAERASRMRADIKKAKIIHTGLAESETVSIGCKVKVLNLTTNTEETYTFLGPWDASPERQIYSYLSPIALSFMGKQVNETVVHNSNAGQAQWKILEITSGI